MRALGSASAWDSTSASIPHSRSGGSDQRSRPVGGVHQSSSKSGSVMVRPRSDPTCATRANSARQAPTNTRDEIVDGDVTTPGRVPRSSQPVTLGTTVAAPEAAVDHLERGIALTKSSGYDHRTVRIVADAVEALIAVERWNEAAPLVDELERCGAKSDRPWALATGARCRGLLQAATGHLAEAEPSVEIATREHQRLPRPFERGRTLLSLGVVQRRLRRQRAARESLNEAHRIFETLGPAR